MNTIDYYKKCFANLHTAKSKGRKAPHKAILLISILDLMEVDVITSNKKELTDHLVDCFNYLWNNYVHSNSGFTPDIGKPYYHMGHEPFWTLIDNAQEISMAAESNPCQKKISYSVKSLRDAYSYAMIDEDLFELLQDHNNRVDLRLLLIKEYLMPESHDMGVLTSLSFIAPLMLLIA